nr:intestinal type alkaline phosphatase 1 [Hymenolepis microstoma]
MAIKSAIVCLLLPLLLLLLLHLPLQVASAAEPDAYQARQQPITYPFPPFTILQKEIPPSYWENLARKEIDKANRLFPEFYSKAKQAKNVILFLGDGMGIPTLAATRFDRTNTTGKAEKHPFEDWQFSSLCRTYDLETMVTDSASSATAYLTGTKTRTAMIGVTGQVFYKECKAYTDEEKTESVLTAAQKIGKWTGIVTSSRITHASPSGCYGHVAFRDWEVDSELPCTKGEFCACTDLAYQLIKEHPDIHVLMGGAQQYFYPDTESLPCNSSAKGARWDGRNLAKEWESTQKSKGRNYVYADSPDAFKNIKFEDYDYALSLISESHLPYELDRPEGDPGLYEQAMAALKILQKSPNGFFLFIEGARIDQAHHENRAMKSFAEQHVFDKIIKDIYDQVDPKETLLIVTADHSHSFELVGQPSRFRSLFLPDLVKGNETLDEKGMQPVGYMTGPGAKMNATRDSVWNMTDETLFGKDTQLQALIPIDWATHGGDDVGVFANGPFSYLFHKTIDNTFVAQAMKYAMCAPPYNKEPFCAGCGLKSSILTFIGVLLWICLN